MEFLSKEEWLKKRKKKRQITAGIIFGTAAVLLILLFVLLIQAIIGLLTEEAPTGEGGQASARFLIETSLTNRAAHYKIATVY